MLTLDDCPGPAFLHSFVGEFGESFQALDGLACLFWLEIFRCFACFITGN